MSMEVSGGGGGISVINNQIYSSSSTTNAPTNNIIQVSGRCGPSLIIYKNLRFLITDKPTDATLNQYIEELQRRNVTDVVRVCESTYSPKRLEQAGIKCHDWAFDDGTPPSNQIIADWLELIVERFKNSKVGSSPSTRKTSSQTNGDDGGTAAGDAASSSPVHSQKQESPCIAVHCVAGLGRAPVLVAIALIEAGMKFEDAVEMIRASRRGAINAKQLQYLSQYKAKKVLIFSNGSSIKKKFCCIV